MRGESPQEWNLFLPRTGDGGKFRGRAASEEEERRCSPLQETELGVEVSRLRPGEYLLGGASGLGAADPEAVAFSSRGRAAAVFRVG